MKFFSDCSGECCVCGCGTGCIAGHGDDFYYEATIEQVVERLNTGRYPAYRQYMIDWLCNKGYKFNDKCEMTDEECKAIEAECLKNVREAIKTITSGDIYDTKGYLNEKGHKALEELEGLDLFWVCDPSIKLVNKESGANNETDS